MQSFSIHYRRQVSVSGNGGDRSAWRADGEMFLSRWTDSSRPWTVKTGASFEAGAPQESFQTQRFPHPAVAFRNNYISSADGQGKFLIATVAQGAVEARRWWLC